MAHIVVDIPEFKNFMKFEADINPKLAYKIFKLITTPYKTEAKNFTETPKTQ
jgi:hypothetical protein